MAGWPVCLPHSELLIQSLSRGSSHIEQAHLTLVNIATLKLAPPRLCLQPQTLASSLDHTHLKMGSEGARAEEVTGRLRGIKGSEVSHPIIGAELELI